MTTPKPIAWIGAFAIAGFGVGWHMLALNLIERYVTDYPSVPDVLMERLPRIDFGLVGELWFFGLLVLFCLIHFRKQWQLTPLVITALGVMYFVRGFFLFFFPIGAPVGAAVASERLSIWGFESHAYFPGGHIAILTILAMFAPERWVRITLWIGLIIFGVGTLLAKTHYTMDSVAGIILGYAISVWLQHQSAKSVTIS